MAATARVLRIFRWYWRVAFAIAAFAIAGRVAQATETWHSAPPMLESRAAHAVVATADAVFALAGTGKGGRPVLEVERFDGREWSRETVLPGAGLNAAAAVALAGRIYLIGGFDTTTNVPTARVRVYDLQTRRWSEVAPLPQARGGHAAAVLDGKIHVVGGGNSERTLADHSVYDPVADRWTEKAPLPRSMGSPAAVVHQGALYSIGGRSGYDDFGDVWRYDAAGDRWIAQPSIPPRGTAGAVSVCNSIVVFGGESQPRRAVLADVLRFDPGQGRWTPLTPMPTPRNFARAVVFDSAVLVVGGSLVPGSSHASAGSTVVERFDPPCRG
jgi:N-acetylneuraminic acid mutarotase